jgi:pSer/pThr/pTyr-binding forkhead associated (FHA) protein
MDTRITLTITRGTSPGKTMSFGDRCVCTVGRAGDCVLQLPNDLVHMDVSRHHCLLDIDPPVVRVRDLGSRNGTYVNGINIGQRPRGLNPEAAARLDLPAFSLDGGDELQVGGTVFRVGIALLDKDSPEAGADEPTLKTMVN